MNGVTKVSAAQQGAPVPQPEDDTSAQSEASDLMAVRTSIDYLSRLRRNQTPRVQEGFAGRSGKAAWYLDARRMIRHRAKMQGGQPVTMPGEDDAVTGRPIRIVLAQCGALVYPPRAADVPGETVEAALCTPCGEDPVPAGQSEEVTRNCKGSSRCAPPSHRAFHVFAAVRERLRVVCRRASMAWFDRQIMLADHKKGNSCDHHHRR